MTATTAAVVAAPVTAVTAPVGGCCSSEPKGLLSTLSLLMQNHSLAFTFCTSISRIFLLTPSDYKPSIPSIRPLEHTPAVPGPVVHFLWSCEVAEHGPHGTPPHGRAAATSCLAEGHVQHLPMTIKGEPLVMGLLGCALGIQKCGRLVITWCQQKYLGYNPWQHSLAARGPGGVMFGDFT